MPRKTRNTPPTIEMMLRYLLNFVRYADAEPMLAAIIKNGTANPRENTARRKDPWPIVAVEAASVSIDPRIGPTHGVQPKANAAPKIRELTGLPGLRALTLVICFSTFKNGNFKMPIINSPKNTTKMPPIRENQILYLKSAAPPRPNKLPRTIKTKLKPITYRTQFKKIFFRAILAFVGSCRSFAETPLINPK